MVVLERAGRWIALGDEGQEAETEHEVAVAESEREAAKAELGGRQAARVAAVVAHGLEFDFEAAAARMAGAGHLAALLVQLVLALEAEVGLELQAATAPELGPGMAALVGDKQAER